MKKEDKINLIIIFSLLLLFVFTSILVCTGLINNIDNCVYNFIISFRCNLLDNYFINITKLGNMISIIFILIICTILFRNKNLFYLYLSCLLSVGVNTIIKNIFCRERPNILRLISEKSYSFPSGHSMITMCCFGYLFYYVYKNIKNKILKFFLLIILGIIIISIPISRIYLGVHYFSDVVGGLILGGLILFIVIKYSHKFIRG